MANIEEAIYFILTNNADIYGTVGGRIYPLYMPDSVELPAITYQRISTVRELTHDQEAGGLASAIFQFTVWDSDYATIREISEMIRNCLNGYKGTVTIDSGDSDIDIQASLINGEVDNYDPEVNLYWTSIDYLIKSEE